MQIDVKQKILSKVQSILVQKIPIDLKARRIVEEVLIPEIEELKSQYERLFFVQSDEESKEN